MLFRVILFQSLLNFTMFPQIVLDVPKFRIYPSTITQTEPVATVHPQNSSIIFSSAVTINVSNGFRSEGVYISTDGGFTWSGNDTCTGSLIVNHGGDPGVVITDNGRLVLSHIGLQFPGMYSNYSDNMTETWSSSYMITSNQSEDKGTLAIDHSTQSDYNGRLYLTWVDYVNLFTVQSSVSSNNGESWSQPVQVNPNPPTRSTGTSLAVASDGTVYLSWAGVTSVAPFYEDYIGFGKSTDGGMSWTINQNILDMNGIAGLLPEKNNIRVNGIPQLVIDNSGGERDGWLYIITTEKNNPPAGSDPDIIMHRSTDNGATWSGGIRVNKDPVSDGKIQYFPYPEVDDQGILNILFYDDRNTTSDSTGVFITRSADGGDHWTEYEIKNSTFEPKPIAGGASNYQGDHIALLTTGDQLNAFWMADYSGIYQVWTSIIDKNLLAVENKDDYKPPIFALSQNYPNPFNPATVIKYSIGKETFVSLKIYDSIGKEVKTLVSDIQSPGEYKVSFNAKNLSSGIYFYSLRTDNLQSTKKMLLIK